ncbi:MAG TPA: Pr6Pr family membrane protein [Sphingobium sp.]|uniref:Pr6Pr family membrane protein n=1 Tax=Sphingobium sp. TaxID=1912891 RepID=UPI002ED3D3C9
MPLSHSFARICAGVVSLFAWAGLVVQFGATFADHGSVAEAVWILVRFFTILTNIMVAVVFGAVALDMRRIATPSLVGCTVLSIILVGVVYAVLLSGLAVLSGAAMLANILLHRVTPIIAPLWWLLFGRQGRLVRADPWRWTAWPLAYLAYALVRGRFEGIFAYPFLNYPDHGWASVLANCLVMALGFVLLGQGMVWIDRRG